MVSLKRRLVQLRVPESAGGGGAPKLPDGLPRAGERRGVPATGERPVSGRTGWERGAGSVEGDYGSDRGVRGNEPGVLTPRGRYLQQHGTNQRVDGPGAGVAHALEAPEHEPALREDGEEVEHGGSRKGARPAPGAEATIAPTSCCAKRGTRHTSGPGNQLSRTSAQSSGIPAPPAARLHWRARRNDVKQAGPWRVWAGLLGGHEETGGQ